MSYFKKAALLIASIGAATAGVAGAAEVPVSSDIATSQVWTSENVYNLQATIHVLPGATLTIEPGTLVKSGTDAAHPGGMLAVTRGGKIYVNGTKDAPVIMTSWNDDMANWHEGCQEWGNLTIMGDAMISASHYANAVVGSNTKTPTGLNEKQMEGIVDDATGRGLYGGANDDDDSGSISFLSLRYGGKVIGEANELNGLSLGGIGRATDISHVEIMNNVDDGIEIWGGTVCLKYINIWNIGDDSFDVDEGWRGKAQFGLIVQGYSVKAKQGSGTGDNCFETDGAEDADAQPVTTAAVYNFTVVGQPASGDHGTAWRDNARVQYRNCIFMELGEQVVAFDDKDTDGANGYAGRADLGDKVKGSKSESADGTLSWYQTWAADYDYSTAVAMPNAGTWTAGEFNDPAQMYQTQIDGKLAELRDCVFYNNLNASAYSELDDIYTNALCLNYATAAAGYNAFDNVVAVDMPIQGITRGTPVFFTADKDYTMVPVTYINPCAANDAVVSANSAPNDGFFVPAQFRGGFSDSNNWLAGWTAVDAYGMTDTSMNTPSADLNSNGIVDVEDLALFSTQWLNVQ